MIRSAAKNHAYVAVCTDAGGHGRGARRAEGRRRDAPRPAPDAWPPAPSPAPRPTTRPSPPGSPARSASGWPARKTIAGALIQTMRYGENPHQAAAFYAFPSPRPGVATARQLQGKELSYNNIDDTDAAFELVAEFDPGGQRRPWPSSSTPIPAAWPWATTWRRPTRGRCSAIRSRPSAASSRSTAGWTRRRPREIVKIFTEVVIAPEADDDAIAVFARQEEPAPAADRRPARSAGAGRDLPARWPAASWCSRATPRGSPPPT